MEDGNSQVNKSAKSGGFFKFALFTLFLTVALLLTYFDTIGKEQEKIQALKLSQLHKEIEEVYEESVSIKEAPDSVILKASVWVPQTFNNCGPATASMILQNYGYTVGQIKKNKIPLLLAAFCGFQRGRGGDGFISRQTRLF